jgi:hypothetical protein
MMSSFDAPSRETCLARRERTNTPLQALVLMNEPQNVEAARHLAQRALREAGAEPTARAAFMMRRVLGRGPSGRDLTELSAAYAAFKEAFAAKPEDARKLIAVGDLKPDPTADPVELAAWTMVGQVILNLDAVLTKE